MVLHVNLTFELCFPFHELHVQCIEIYQKLILHVQIEQDSPYISCRQSRRANLFTSTHSLNK